MARKRAEKPAACRQKIINFLVANPGSTALQIATGLGYVKRSVQNYLPAMRNAKEIKSTEYRVGRTAVWRHAALVALAAPAPEDDLGEEGLVTKVVGNLTTHRGTTRDCPLPSMGGQGAVRGPRVATYLETMA